MQLSLQVCTLESRPELYNEVVDLIEKSLNYSSDNNYEIDFLPLMDVANQKHIHIFHEQDTIFGVIGCYPTHLEHESHQVPVVFIGGICIDEQFRGKGLFKIFFEHILNLYQEQCALFFLWSDLHELYSKFNFVPAVTQYESLGSWSKLRQEINNYGFQQIFPERDHDLHLWKQIPALWENTTKNWWRIGRDENKWIQILRMHSCHKFVRLNSDGQVQDYFFVNKGEDLDGVIHEIGSIYPLQHLQAELSIGRVWTPDHFRDQEHFKEGNSSLVRMGSLKMLVDFFKHFTDGMVTDMSYEEGYFCFNFQGKLFKVSSDEFIAGILGPFPFAELPAHKNPIFIGGVDSI